MNPVSPLVLAVLMAVAAPVAAASWDLSADSWSRPRSGDRVAGMEPVRAAVAQWSLAPDSRILIGYPGGESGALWAEELKDWLVALGVPSASIAVRPGSAQPDALEIRVEVGGERP
jgi:hypothetical protein